MGYQAPQPVFRLVFEDRPELVIRLRGMTAGEVLAIERAGAGGGADATELSYRLLAAKVVEWNLVGSDGAPVPETYEGVLTLDQGFVLEIIQAWQEAVLGVPGPLGQRSTAGGTSPAA